jgi:hypothetical protein
MITFRITAEIKDDHQIVLTLPPEVPTGQAELVISVASPPSPPSKPPRSSLAEWAEQNAEHWGQRLSAQDVEGFTGRRF